MKNIHTNILFFLIIPIIIYLVTIMFHEGFSIIRILSITITFFWWTLFANFFNNEEYNKNTFIYQFTALITWIIYIWLGLYWFFYDAYYILIPIIILLLIPKLSGMQIRKNKHFSNFSEKETAEMNLRTIWLEVIDKSFESVIDYHLTMWLNDLKKINKNDINTYNLLIWASYQEVWELDKAYEFFRYYLENNSLSKKDSLKGCNENVTKLFYLSKELSRYWLTYNVNINLFTKKEIKDTVKEIKKYLK